VLLLRGCRLGRLAVLLSARRSGCLTTLLLLRA
jgi:hypothetical protein